MAQYPSDTDIDQKFPTNTEGLIGADDMRDFQKQMTAAGRDYTAMTDNVPTEFPPAAHTHVEADITDLDKYTQAQVDAAINTRAPTVHTHTEAQITDLDKYSRAEADAKFLTSAQGDARYVQLSGGTMTGLLTLSGPPTLPLHAATKQYVDDNAGGGGIPEAPQNNLAYARRNAAWLDLKLQGGTAGQVLKKLDGTDFGYGWADETGGGSGIPEAPSDGNYYARRNNSWANADDAFLTPAEGNAAYAAIVHTHTEAQITDLDKYTQAEVDAAIATRAPTVHTHTEAQITDLDKYTQAQTNALLADKVDVEVGGTTSRGQSVWVGTSAELAAITNGPGRDPQTLYFVLE